MYPEPAKDGQQIDELIRDQVAIFLAIPISRHGKVRLPLVTAM